MTIDEFVKLALGLALSVAVLGIGIQIMRLLGTTNEILKDFRFGFSQLSLLLEKVNGDYDQISKVFRNITNPLGRITQNIMEPFTKASDNISIYLTNFLERVLGRNGQR